jgi:hypothetical protein
MFCSSENIRIFALANESRLPPIIIDINSNLPFIFLSYLPVE